MKPWMIGLIVTALIGGAFYFGSQYGSNKIEIKYRDRDKLVHDSSYANEVRLLLTGKIDSLKAINNFYALKNLTGKIDTFYFHDTIYKNIPLKFASTDTIITKDSSLIKIRYLFPPINKFDVWASIKSKIRYIPEIHEIEKPETFWDRFGLSIQTGLGYGWVHKNVDFYTGIGAHFKFN